MPEPVTVLTADIGGTATRAALVDDGGRIIARRRFDTLPERGIEDATGRLLDAFGEVMRGAQPAAVGVSSAGPLDPSTGIYHFPPNLPGWHNHSMQPALALALGLPVVVGHDATLAAVAECRFGVHRGARDLLYLTVSTGIGAGIVAGGRPVTGHSGGAGEAGHLIVDYGGASCLGGCPGCLEGASSGTAIARAAQERMAAGEASALPGRPSAREVFAAAEAGDPLARDVVRTAIGHLATGIASLLAVFDPEVLVIGGGVAPGLQQHWQELLDAVRARALARYQERLPIAVTTLGDDASLLGAAAVALDEAGRAGSG